MTDAEAMDKIQAEYDKMEAAVKGMHFQFDCDLIANKEAEFHAAIRTILKLTGREG